MAFAELYSTLNQALVRLDTILRMIVCCEVIGMDSVVCNTICHTSTDRLEDVYYDMLEDIQISFLKKTWEEIAWQVPPCHEGCSSCEEGSEGQDSLQHTWAPTQSSLYKIQPHWGLLTCPLPPPWRNPAEARDRESPHSAFPGSRRADANGRCSCCWSYPQRLKVL